MKNSKETLLDALREESRRHLLLFAEKLGMTKNSDDNK